MLLKMLNHIFLISREFLQHNSGTSSREQTEFHAVLCHQKSTSALRYACPEVEILSLKITDLYYIL